MHIATDPTINSYGKFEFIKFAVQTLNAQLSERFTDHQGLVTIDNIMAFYIVGFIRVI